MRGEDELSQWEITAIRFLLLFLACHDAAGDPQLPQAIELEIITDRWDANNSFRANRRTVGSPAKHW
jgi:hypothetical protein